MSRRQEPDETRRHPMQHKARGKRGSPEQAGAPEYYAKDRMPDVAKPGPEPSDRDETPQDNAD
jgi:hypothetical protein